MGLTLSLAPPTSSVAPTQAPGPLAPCPGLPTRPGYLGAGQPSWPPSPRLPRAAAVPTPPAPAPGPAPAVLASRLRGSWAQMGSWGLIGRTRFHPPLCLGFWTKPNKNGHTHPPCWVRRREEGCPHGRQPKCPLELAKPLPPFATLMLPQGLPALALPPQCGPGCLPHRSRL